MSRALLRLPKTGASGYTLGRPGAGAAGAEGAGLEFCMQDGLHGLVWVALGALVGGPARYFLSGVIARRVGETFPWGTMAVNVSGAFAIGIIAAVATNHALPHTQAPWQFAVIGILGSYTTVSSFSLQTLMLLRDGDRRRAAANIALSLALCLGAVALGYTLGAAAMGGA